MSPRRPERRPPHASTGKVVETRLRVIGGTHRGRTIHYNGDVGLRPMKDRVREAVFNLVGVRVKGTLAVDLFAGTGAMSFESLSRGARAAIVYERSVPNSKCLSRTAEELGFGDRLQVRTGDTFIQVRLAPLATDLPWLVFCCPPYELYLTRRDDLLRLMHRMWEASPPGSVFVVESDERFNPTEAWGDWEWDVRTYAPAVIGLAVKPPSVERGSS